MTEKLTKFQQNALFILGAVMVCVGVGCIAFQVGAKVEFAKVHVVIYGMMLVGGFVAMAPNRLVRLLEKLKFFKRA